MNSLQHNHFIPQVETLEDRNMPSAAGFGGLPIITHTAAHPGGLPFIAHVAAHRDGLPIITQGLPQVGNMHLTLAQAKWLAEIWHDGTVIDMRRPGRWGGIIAEL